MGLRARLIVHGIEDGIDFENGTDIKGKNEAVSENETDVAKEI